jgi:hypothetical protein
MILLTSAALLPFVPCGMHSLSLPQRIPMIARNPRRGWPVIVTMGLPVGAFLCWVWLLSRTEWPTTTWSVFALVVALVPWLRAGYVAALGPKRWTSLVWGGAGLVLVGAAAVADGMRTDNQLPPGWPSEMPRYPGAWTGRGSVGQGQRAWFVRKREGRASPHEVTYGGAHPHALRVASKDDRCTDYQVGTRLLHVCPDGKNEVAVSLEEGSRSGR